MSIRILALAVCAVSGGLASAQNWVGTLDGAVGSTWIGSGELDVNAVRYEGELVVTFARAGLSDSTSVDLADGVEPERRTWGLELRGRAPTPGETRRVVLPRWLPPESGYAVRASLTDRWLTGDANIAVVGDSISAPVYTTGQGSLTHGLARIAGERLVGMQWPVNNLTGGGEYAAREANFLNFFANYSGGSFWSNNPFGRPGAQATYGGEVAFMPIVGRQTGFTTNMSGGRRLFSYIMEAPFFDSGETFWLGRDDARLALLWHKGISTADALLSVETWSSAAAGAPANTLEYATSWNPASGDPGLNYAEFNVSSPRAERVELRFVSTQSAPTQNTDIVTTLPMLHLADATGIRVWNLGLGGWGYREHSRNTPLQYEEESPGQYYTDTALEQFYAGVAATGRPINTLVFALGANDSWAGTGDPPRISAQAARRAIERHAEAARRHVEDAQLEVLIIAPYAVPFSTPSTQWTNADAELWSIAIFGTGDALGRGQTVRSEQISFISLHSMMNGIELDDYAPGWQEDNGGVHPSPLGADGLAAIIETALLDPGTGFEPDGVEPPAVDLVLETLIDAEGRPVVRVDRIEFGTFAVDGGEPLDVVNIQTQFALTLEAIERPPVDLSGDGLIGVTDLAILLGSWGPCGGLCPADLNVDGRVGAADLGELIGLWGQAP